MNLLAGGFSSFVNVIFENWQILLFVLLVVLLLLVIIFRKFKLVPWILGIICIAVFAALVIMLITAAVNWNTQQLLDFCVKWIPTVIFTLTIFFATVLGIFRGLRKSLILLLHEVCIGAVCIIIYALLVNLPQVDGFMLKLVDFFMGGSGSLQKATGVIVPCEGLKDVFVEWLPSVVDKFNTDFGMLLSGSKAYIYTLADLIYHVAFALVLYVVYLLLDFILYIIYLCCYSERKYKRRKNHKFAMNKIDRRYHKHSVGGGVVGVVRGLTIGLLTMSFLGSTLYVAAGRGDGKMKDFDFGSTEVNEYYSLYRSVESYGTYGIFKILNCVSSSDDVPYYLFAADLVFSGELDDEEFGISDHIVFREELDAYTGFARDTMSLLVKYGGEEIRSLIGNTNDASAFDTVVQVMSNEMFRAEFNDLIGEFDAKTYIINFAMSFVNTMIANIDEVTFTQSVSRDNRELLKVLFTKGYLSDVIPDEAEAKQQRASSDSVHPYISVSKLVTKKDVQIIFNVVLDLLTKNTSSVNEVLSLVGDLLPTVQKLSLLSSDRAEELNPVLGRLYCYAANRYLTAEGSKGVTYASVYEENVAWTDEINSLIGVANSGLKLYNNINKDGRSAQDMLLDIFDKENENYAANIASYDNICKSIYKSKLLGKTLATSYISKLISTALGIYVPDDIKYESTYDANGKMVEAGELYNLFTGIGNIGKASELLPLLVNFNKDNDMQTLLDTLSDTLNSIDNDGHTVKHYIVKSRLLRSAISAVLITTAKDYVYVPMVARDKNAEGETVACISEAELTTLFDNIDSLLEFIEPVIKDNTEIKQAVADFVNKKEFNALIDESRIFEGTVGKLLADSLADDSTVVIPAALSSDYEGWVTVNGKKGELKNVLDAIDLVGLDVAKLIKGEFDTGELKDKALKLTTGDLEKALDSRVLHYTLTKALVGDEGSNGVRLDNVTIIVPVVATSTYLVGENDVLKALVTKDELKALWSAVEGLDLNGDVSIEKVFTQLVKNKSALNKSNILSASIVGTIVNDESIADMLNLPSKFGKEEDGSYAKLKNYNSSNCWKGELVKLVDALDEVFGISAGEEFTLEEEKLKDKLSTLFRVINENSTVKEGAKKVTVCCASEVIRNCITVRLDDLLDGKVEREITVSAKTGGYYTEEELSSLSKALVVFDIDIMKIEGDELTTKVKNDILNMNDPVSEGSSRSKLDEVYPSRIFSGMFSKELDKVLLDKEPAEGQESDPMIEGKALSYIKNRGARYSQEDVSSLIRSIRAYGITDFDKINDVKFDTIKDKRDNLPEICDSRIVCAVFTKQVKKNNQLNVDHPKAYEEEPYEKDVKILRYDEIESLVNLFSETDNEEVENMYFEDLKFAALEENLFLSKDGDRVKSYLVLAAVSDRVIENRNLSVNAALVDGYKCIDPAEVRALINAFIAINGDGDSVSLGSWMDNESGNFKYPASGDVRLTVLKSEIARAKLTEQFIEENTKVDSAQKNSNFIKKGNITEYVDYRLKDTRRVILSDELKAMCAALDIINPSDENKFSFPKIDLALLSGLSAADISTLYKSSLIRYKVSDCVRENFEEVGYPTDERAINLNGFEEEFKKVVPEAKVLELLGK